MSNLNPNKDALKKPKRVGRGIGSGNGKTAGRGHKGQKSRSGASIPAWFEGGQQPLYRRIPKRGFKNLFKKEWVSINLGDIAKAVSSGKITEKEITRESLVKASLVSRLPKPVKLLGAEKGAENLSALSGTTIKLQAASAGADEKLKSAGGSFEKVELPRINRSKKASTEQA